MKYNSYGTEYELSFRKGHYQNNNTLAVQIMSKEASEDWYEPFCMLTVNLPTTKSLAENRAYVDTNNCPSDLVQLLEEQGVMKRTLITAPSGYCIYPLYEFSQEWLNKLSSM